MEQLKQLYSKKDLDWPLPQSCAQTIQNWPHLIFRAQKICSPDTLSEELNTIKCTLLQNGYPVHLLQQYMDQIPPPKSYGPQRKLVFLKLSFISDKISGHIKSVCTDVTQRYFPAVQPIVLHTTTTIPQKSPKDPLPKIAKSNAIYHFKCGCGSSYIGKTSRRLGDRMKEHIPMWIQKG